MTKICLLLTDDPDDQQTFSNAISEISPENILLTIVDVNQAVAFLARRECFPQYIFVDASMYGMNINQITNAVKDGSFKKAPLIVYGYEEDSMHSKNSSDFPFFNKDSTYTELVKFLRGVLEKRM